MLTIVAFDGNNVVPYQADIVVIQPGERVDFIIFTNRPSDNYRINYLTTAIGDFSGVFKKKKTFQGLLFHHIIIL